uniref:Uncharacterized protein n=1 Tax=Siphoviridae sp. ctiOl67 TaxID=2825622 RepID=A0A8S5QJE4_9CAUD|nr:MAG TPA: hypothetical protein [Siphoviridae sp. ctiOl67]
MNNWSLHKLFLRIKTHLLILNMSTPFSVV